MITSLQIYCSSEKRISIIGYTIDEKKTKYLNLHRPPPTLDYEWVKLK